MRFIKSIFAAGATMLLTMAVKKLIGGMEKQAEAARAKREDERDPKEFKRLKQDPTTGVYYAEE
jgi:hypothetical protein